MNKAKVNYAVDALILLAFTLASASGVVLLLIPGGRGLSQVAVLGLTRSGWVELHDWTAIGTMIGVLFHFVLHWKWVACMTDNVLHGLAPRHEKPCPVVIESPH